MMSSTRRHALPITAHQSRQAKLSRKASTVPILAALLFLGLVSESADLGIRRALTQVRKLCSVKFEHGDWATKPEGYWEQLFGADVIYVAPDPPIDPVYDPLSIGYVLSMPSCPDDKTYQPGVSTADAKRSLYDAASILKFSTCDQTSQPQSKYSSAMYAIVHPDAVRCTGPDGAEYDRIQVLQSLGYHVFIRGQPVVKTAIKDKYVQDNVDKDAGIRDLTKLTAFTLEHHPVAVMVDFSTVMLKNMDAEFDKLIASKDTNVMYTLDDEGAPNTDFLMVKPSMSEYDNILSTYKSTSYDVEKGWDSKGVAKFPGVLGTKGILKHYYGNVKPGAASQVDKCRYSNDGISSACAATSMDNVKVATLSAAACGSPWDCPDKAVGNCESLHKSWFTMRSSYEKSYWTNGIATKQAKTSYKPDTFLGYCSEAGSSGYIKMIYDKQATATSSASSMESQQLQVKSVSYQKLEAAPLVKESSTATKLEAAPLVKESSTSTKLAAPTTTELATATKTATLSKTAA